MVNFLSLLLIAIFCAAATAWEPTVTDAQWEFFKTQHDKYYDSLAEDSFRQEVFMENLEKINEHNALYEQGLVSYKLGINQFTDLTEEEFHRNYTLLMSENWFNDFMDDDFIIEAPELDINQTQLPTSVDWRAKGAVTPVKNQGNCGSCWTFSATGALESQWFKKTHRLVQLSEQNLLDCTGRYGNIGCNGGRLPSTFKYIIDNHGIDTEKSYPYEGRVGRCRYRAKNRGATLSRIVQFHGEPQLQSYVSSVGPISVAVEVSNSFHQYKGGLYDDPRCGHKLNHAMVVVGYGTERGKDYWLVKNSWGPQWGEHGYIKMARNRGNQCGIADFPIYPVV